MTKMPWDVPQLSGWSIVGMNHYRMGGAKKLFVAMTKDGHCIVSEGADEQAVFVELASLAAGHE